MTLIDRPTHDDAQDRQIDGLRQRLDAHIQNDNEGGDVLKNESGWHLDRRVPITLIITLLLQAAAGLWFAAKMDSRVASLEHVRVEQKERDNEQDRAVRDTAALIRADLTYIRAQLDELIREGRPRR